MILHLTPTQKMTLDVKAQNGSGEISLPHVILGKDIVLRAQSFQNKNGDLPYLHVISFISVVYSTLLKESSAGGAARCTCSERSRSSRAGVAP